MEAPIKFYIAGKWMDKPAIQKLQTIAKANGHQITHDWTTHEFKYTDRDDLMKQAAAADIDGVKDCDVLVVLMNDPTYPYRGTFTEIGAALGLGKKIYILGPRTVEAARNCFWFHPAIVHGDTSVTVEHNGSQVTFTL